MRDRNWPVGGDHGPKGSSAKQERDPFTELPKKKQGGRRSGDKGNRVECQFVELHKTLGVHCERYPLSGSSRFRGSGHDIDIYTSARNSAPIIPLSRPRIERERDGWGWLVLLPSGHGWLCGDRREALREFAGLVDIERWRSA